MMDLIESVAKGLGWEVRPAPGYTACVIIDRSVDLPGPSGPSGPRCWYFFQPYHPHLGEPDCKSLILYAQYAKAAMAKRGWLVEYPFQSAPPQGGRSDLHICMMTVGKCSKPFQFDPVDPASEAEAVLRCCADALQSTGGAEAPQRRESGYIDKRRRPFG